MDRTPASLLQRLRQPAEQAAWGRFVELFTPLIYYWARRLGLQHQDAADLVQDVFTVLVQKLPGFSYDEHRSFRSWLRTVTVNKWRDHCRRRALPRENNAALDNLADPDAADGFWETEYRRQVVGHALEVMQAEFQPTTWKACWELVVCDRPRRLPSSWASARTRFTSPSAGSCGACAGSWKG